MPIKWWDICTIYLPSADLLSEYWHRQLRNPCRLNTFTKSMRSFYVFLKMSLSDLCTKQRLTTRQIVLKKANKNSQGIYTWDVRVFLLQIADWAWVLLHRMQIPLCEKAFLYLGVYKLLMWKNASTHHHGLVEQKSRHAHGWRDHYLWSLSVFLCCCLTKETQMLKTKILETTGGILDQFR